MTKIGSVTYHRFGPYKFENKVTITYNANGGTGAPGKQTVNINSSTKISSTQPKRDGYYFKGWSTTKNGNIEYTSGQTITANKNLTLYAVWAVKKKILIAFTNTYTGTDAAVESWEKRLPKIQAGLEKSSKYTYDIDSRAGSSALNYLKSIKNFNHNA